MKRLWICLTVLAASSPAWAQDGEPEAPTNEAAPEGPSPDDVSRADELFRSARELMQAGDHAAACPKLVESQKLDPGAGTLLNLGLCYRELGDVRRAWEAYGEAAAAARAAQQPDREAHALQQVEQLAAKLPRLRLVAPAELAGARLTLDERELAPDELAAPIVVEAGTHEVVVVMDGQPPAVHAIEARDGEIVELVLPAPQREPAPSPAPSPTSPAPNEGLSAQETAAIVVGGVGAVGLVLGAVFGALALSDKSSSDELCSENDVCHPEGIELRDQAATKATISTATFVVGGAAAAAAIVLAATAPSSDEVALTGVPGADVGLGIGLRW